MSNAVQGQVVITLALYGIQVGNVELLHAEVITESLYQWQNFTLLAQR